jgi:hypothetical protein
MKYISIMLSIVVVSLLVSCRTEMVLPNYDTWLQSQNMPSEVDLTGKWDAGNAWGGGWGEANLIQQGRDVYGTLGVYRVKGVVSNKTIFLTLISSGDHVYYTAKLTMKKDGSFLGIAVKEALVDSPEAAKAEIYAITFNRMK